MSEAAGRELLHLHSHVRLLVLLVTLALVLASMAVLPPIIGVNDGSRWDTAWAVSTGRGYVIDEAPYETVDKVFRDGHFYSSKPALMPTVAGWLLKAVSLNNRLSLEFHEQKIVRIILLIINVLPLAILIVLYDRLLGRWKVSAPVRLFCLVAASLGTYVTPYSTSLNNHTQAAWATFFSLYCLLRILEDPRRAHGGWHAGAGLFAAWAAANENPAVAYLLIVLGVLLVKQPRKALAYCVPMVAVVVAAFFYTTWQATGRLYPYSLNWDKETYYTYPGSVWPNPTGIDSQHEPKWWYAFNLILGHHGLLSLTPIFIFGLWGLMRGRKAFDAPHAAASRIGLWLVVAVTVLYIFATHNYGGGCQGPRWLMWLTPFLLIGLPPVLERHFHARAFRAMAYSALFVSVFSIGYALVQGPWGHARDSWLHWVFRWLRLIDY